MDNIKNLVIVACLSFVFGFGVGSYTEGKFTKAKQLEAATEAQSQTATEIKQSLDETLAVESKVAASNKQISKIRSDVAAHLKVKSDESTTKECNAADAVIDGDTVFMLNAARGGISPTAGSDGEVPTPPSVAVTVLIDNDLEVVQMYRELAERHDSLVDWVQSKINKQSER